ncbi:hypothetical protein DFH09DRAFT_1383726 [Mycena vulgaris]|nr:hypothetical protein DFH09DRAFT_1383726 [Mycena vulgaris]
MASASWDGSNTFILHNVFNYCLQNGIRFVSISIPLVEIIANIRATFRLSKSGLKISKIDLGCLSYGNPNWWRNWVLPEEEASKHIKAAYDAGINAFDTGVSMVEEIVQKRGIGMAQLSIASYPTFEVISAPIVDIASLANLADALAANHIKLTEDEVKKEPHKNFEPVNGNSRSFETSYLPNVLDDGV